MKFNKYSIPWPLIVTVCVIALLTSCRSCDNAKPESWEKNLGELIIEDDDLTLYLQNQIRVSRNLPNDDFSLTDDKCLIRYIGTTPTDTCSIIGSFGDVIGEGSLCKIIVGIDTVSINPSTSLPDSIDVRFANALPDTQCATISRHFKLHENAPTIDFQLNIGIPNEASLKLKQYLSHKIREDIEGLFNGEIEERFRYIETYNLNDGSMDEMLEYYFNGFQRFYNLLFETEFEREYDVWDWNFSTQVSYCPVWISDDKSLLTFRYVVLSSLKSRYCFHFEDYFTIDCSNMNVLGWPDFYTEEKCSEVIKKHENELYLDDSDKSRLFENKPISEIYKSAYQPQPALIGDKIVFSYTKWYKGAVADKNLYFTEPYEISNLKRKR